MFLQQQKQEYTCRIPHHYFMNKKVVYVIIIISQSYLTAKVHRLRYSQCEKFHAQLEKTISQLRIITGLPAFPGKKLFGSHNNTVEGIQRRKIELKTYYNQLLQLDNIQALPQMVNFLPDTSDENELSQLILAQSAAQNFVFIIDSFKRHDDVVFYFIQVIDNKSKTKWRYKARYSDLRDIHEALKACKTKLPEFPKRNIFGTTNDSLEEIEKRRKGLEQYLNDLFSDPELCDNEVLVYFIQNSIRESKKLQKYDEQKMISQLKIKSTENNFQKKVINQSLKKSLYPIKQQSQEDESSI
ncbi:Sorting nexin-17 [Paramecium bursaria]